MRKMRDKGFQGGIGRELEGLAVAALGKNN